MKGRKLSSPHPQRKVQLLNLQRGKKTLLSVVGETSVGQEAQFSQREASVSRPTVRRNLLSPGERFINEKRHAVEEKLAEAAEKRKVLEEKKDEMLPLELIDEGSISFFFLTQFYLQDEHLYSLQY